jgi:hypothetical protein
MSNAMRVPMLVLSAAVAAACAEPATSALDTEPAMQASLSAARCMNVEYQGLSALGPWLLDGEIVPGAPPAPVTFGGVDGWLASVLDVENLHVPGKSGTTHWSLRHYFLTHAPAAVDLGGGFIVPAIDLSAQASFFYTDDRAVCAAAGRDPLSCRVNDIMSVRGGTGIFANAGGFLHNHGTITLVDPALGIGSGDFRLRGRVCGDGL